MILSSRLARCVLCFGCLLPMAGCGGEAGRGSVQGKVTLDGQPLENGHILFKPAEGNKGASAEAAIQNGEYKIDQAKGPGVGPCTVEIRSQRKTGKQVPVGSPAPAGAMADEIVEAVPDKYNAHTTLRQEVKAGQNTCDFDLTTK